MMEFFFKADTLIIADKVTILLVQNETVFLKGCFVRTVLEDECCNVEVVGGGGQCPVWGTGRAAGEAKVAGGSGVEHPPRPAAAWGVGGGTCSGHTAR